MLKLFYMLLILLVLLSTATYTWFSLSRSPKINDMSLYISTITGLELAHDSLVRFFVEQAKVGLNDGAMFGPGGEGFMRMNVGCPRATLEEAMRRIKEAYDRL